MGTVTESRVTTILESGRMGMVVSMGRMVEPRVVFEVMVRSAGGAG